MTGSGALERLEVAECSVLLYPASALADGLGGLWLRRRGRSGVVPISLIGQSAPTRAVPEGLSPADRSGRWGELAVSVTLRLSEQRAAWFWHISVTNSGAHPVELDLVHAADVALAPLSAVRTNEYYLSQYLDLTSIDVPGHGVAIGVRQNMPGPTPWLLVGCLGSAGRWATDAVQLTGRGRVEGAPWPGLTAELPAARLQGEHTVAALQTEPTILEPGNTWHSGFYGLYLPEHNEATSAADAQHAATALADPAATQPDTVDPVETASPDPAGLTTDHRSLFGTAEPLTCRALAPGELDRLAGTDRIEPELEGDELLSFFTSGGAQVVTAAKQARVLRPHGHLFRSGSSLLPDEHSICATVWMDGTFCSQLTQGHVSLGAIMSVRRSYLGLAPAHGLRVFVRANATTGWALLGTPSAWSVSLQECRWWYASDPSAGSGHGGLIEVTTRVRAESDTVEVEVVVRDGAPVELFAAAHIPWLDSVDASGTRNSQEGSRDLRTPEPDGVRISPPADSPTAAIFPGGSVHLGWTPGSAEAGDDGALFLDARSRGLPWLTLQTLARKEWRLTLTPELIAPDPTRRPDPGFWPATAGAVTLQAPDTAAGRELNRIATVVPWFTHDAVIHYLSPRGLEQYTGGAWGTRDVSQGPVGLLLTLGADAELRRLVLLIMRAQNARGDWPQAFDFLERHRQDGQSGSHGDVVYWPLLALSQYLAATGDDSILDEQLSFSGDDGPTAPVAVADHVRTALDHIETTFIAGTTLPAYGHGDWNDSLQPVDPELAARLCSSWTVVLHTHVLGTLGAEMGRHESTQELSHRALRSAEASAADLRRLLLVDGVLAGYGLFAEPTNDTGRSSSGNRGLPTGSGRMEVEPLIHPRDDRTGLTYSILAMIHGIADDVFTPDEAKHHLQLITDHLLGPDGARLFDRPVRYAGGPMTLFQRAEASTFFGREIGIMYMHAHLRYAEALARVGNGPALLKAMALAQPVGITDRVRSARPRQSTCYYSSSDAAFSDRYAAHEGYRGIFDHTVPLEGGWRVYSSGPGLFLQLLVQHQLGIRAHGAEVQIDPVLDPDLDGLIAQLPLLGRRRTLRYAVGARGHGVVSVRVGETELPTVQLANPYRSGGVSVATADLRRACSDGDRVVEIVTE